MRMFMAGLATETNSFAPFPTGASAFGDTATRRDASHDPASLLHPMFAATRARARAAGHDVIESIAAVAQPGGPTVRAVHHALRDTILDDLMAAASPDVIILHLHGAMIAEGEDDCEGDLLARVRALCPRAVIGATLDPHCHLTAAMVEAADLLACYLEYPHTDMAARAGALTDICFAIARGEIRPVAALVDTGMIGLYPTLEPPMAAIVAELRALETEPGIVSASLAHGFPWGDTADTGTRTLVYADGDAVRAGSAAMALAARLYACRYQLLPAYPDIAASLDRAAALDARVVLGDFADNPGGGAPGDSSFLLAALIERGSVDAAIGPIHDPAVAAIAADAGAGARLRIRLGGKAGPASGAPIDLTVEVLQVTPAHSQDAFGGRVTMGLCAALRCGGIDILVSSRRAQAYGLDLFTGAGIDLATKRLVVVKSGTHYAAAFGAIADALWSVGAPGALSTDFAARTYARRKDEFFPRILDPWERLGRPVPQGFPGRNVAGSTRRRA